MDFTERIEENSRAFLNQQLTKDKLRIIQYILDPSLLRVKRQFKKLEKSNNASFLPLALKVENSMGYLRRNKFRSYLDDLIFGFKYGHPDRFIPVEAELAIVVIARNEGRYIEEWIDYYKLMGIDHIYFFDNRSTDNTKELLHKYVLEGFVTYIFLNGEKAQLPAYRYALKKIRKKTKWIAFIDADEFIYTKQGTIKEFLRKMEDCPGVVVNWVVYGPGNHDRRPEGGVIENYLLTSADIQQEMNVRVKTIAKADKVWDMRSPHYCIYKNNACEVDENKNPVDASQMLVPGSGRAFTRQNSTNKIRINHYWTKSLQDLEEKCKRGYAAGKDEPQYNKILSRLDFPQKADRELAEIWKKMSSKK